MKPDIPMKGMIDLKKKHLFGEDIPEFFLKPGMYYSNAYGL